jgi:hypothetical protein
MPNIRELSSISAYALSPPVDPIFGIIAPIGLPGARYWSSTTLPNRVNFAFFVDFGDGFISMDGKLFPFWGPGLLVRAVRDGRCQP